VVPRCNRFQGKGPFLTNLKLTGNQLSWDHDGLQHSEEESRGPLTN
jgi:hypothetical protein